MPMAVIVSCFYLQSSVHVVHQSGLIESIWFDFSVFVFQSFFFEYNLLTAPSPVDCLPSWRRAKCHHQHISLWFCLCISCCTSNQHVSFKRYCQSVSCFPHVLQLSLLTSKPPLQVSPIELSNTNKELDCEKGLFNDRELGKTEKRVWSEGAEKYGGSCHLGAWTQNSAFAPFTSDSNALPTARRRNGRGRRWTRLPSSLSPSGMLHILFSISLALDRAVISCLAPVPVPKQCAKVGHCWFNFQLVEA